MFLSPPDDVGVPIRTSCSSRLYCANFSFISSPEICWICARSWISWISVRVWPTFLKYADTMGSSVCSTSRLMSPKRWMTSGAFL
jgi:hypothetical protein